MSDGFEASMAEIHGAHLRYEVRGSGEPLLLLHGMGGCGGDWEHAGRDLLAKEYQLIIPDARGHGRSTNPGGGFRHSQLAMDALALLDHLGVPRCKAIGMSMGGNTLLHLATEAPDRVSAMVLVSATMSFPEQARAIMRQVVIEAPPPAEWERMRKIHVHGDEQILAIWQAQRDLGDSHDDMAFAMDDLSHIQARTLIVYGDRDPLYPVEMAVHMYRGIHGAALWVIPGGGHGPIFTTAAPLFAKTALDFLR